VTEAGRGGGRRAIPQYTVRRYETMSVCPVCGKVHEPNQSCAGQPADSRVGQVVAGKYRVTKLIGEGGMATVYEARHTTIDRPFALKFLHPWLSSDDEWLERFHREASAGGALVSEHIAAILDIGVTADGAPYILMEMLRGEDLGHCLAREVSLKPPDAIEVISQACHGLAVAHRAGVIHRDLKPENVFLCQRELGGTLVKVLDFGIAKLRNAQATHATRAGMVMGTPYYMSPEQARGRGGVDHRTDVYALGVMLYELLSGDKPYVADDHGSVLNQIVGGPTPQLAEVCPTLSAELCAIVQKAIAKDPDTRFQSAEAFAEGLLPFWPQTRRASRTANVFGSKALRITESEPHKTSAEPGVTVRVTGERNGHVSPVGVPIRRIGELGAPSVPTMPAASVALDFSDRTEPDAMQLTSAPPSACDEPAEAAPDSQTRASTPEARVERGREKAGVYPAADATGTRPTDAERGAEQTPVPTAVQTVSLGRTLAPLLLGIAAIALMVGTVVRASSSAESDGDRSAAAEGAESHASEQLEGTVEVIDEDWGAEGASTLPEADPAVPAVVAVPSEAPGGLQTGEEPVGSAVAPPTADPVKDVPTTARTADGSPELAKAQGWLSVSSTPPATLWIGDQKMGKTPMQRVRLAVGGHRITLTHPVLGSETRSVNIKSDDLAELKVTFTPPDVDAMMARQEGTAAPAPSTSASARIAAPTPRNCDPRWELDSNGVRRLKPECLRAP